MVIKDTVKVYKINASDIPGGATAFDGIDLASGDPEKANLFARAYAQACVALGLTCGFNPPLIVNVTYLNGSSESFFHGADNSSFANFRIPGTQKGPAGTNVCLTIEGKPDKPIENQNSIDTGGGPLLIPVDSGWHGYACTSAGEGDDKVYSCQAY